MTKAIIIVLCCLVSIVQAQRISKVDYKALLKKQDTLTNLSWRMSNEISPLIRLKSDSLFTKVLVRALSIKNSYYFAFDSVLIAKVYAPDSTFKIFTWQIERSKNQIRQRGVVQHNTPNGLLKLTPLIDNSEFMENDNLVVTPKEWVGALYYNILLNQVGNTTYYTLLGYDDNKAESNKKWIDVLTFTPEGTIQFGAPIIKHTTQGLRNRLCIEYKKEAKVKLNWDDEQGMIIYDHLTSDNGFINQRKTYVPDGDYEGLQWTNGLWVHNPKVMCNCPLRKAEDPLLGNPEMGKPLYDKDGKKLIPTTPPANTGGG